MMKSDTEMVASPRKRIQTQNQYIHDYHQQSKQQLKDKLVGSSYILSSHVVEPFDEGIRRCSRSRKHQPTNDENDDNFAKFDQDDDDINDDHDDKSRTKYSPIHVRSSHVVICVLVILCYLFWNPSLLVSILNADDVSMMDSNSLYSDGPSFRVMAAHTATFNSNNRLGVSHSTATSITTSGIEPKLPKMDVINAQARLALETSKESLLVPSQDQNKNSTNIAEFKATTAPTSSSSIREQRIDLKIDQFIQEQQQQQQENDSTTSAVSPTDKKVAFTLDEYYTRSHRSYKVHHIRQKYNLYPQHVFVKQPPLLIVGGSDGSGTRAVADILQNELGVMMHVDDLGTLDIDAKMFGNGEGWPSIVNRILEYTRSANYDVSTLPPVLYHDVIQEMKQFKLEYDTLRDSKQFAHNTRWYNNLIPGPGGYAWTVDYGFKAPVSMLLLPLFQHVFGNIKFVHVVRDGRDVCVSSNNSPVTKFYDFYYGPNEAQRRRDQARLYSVEHKSNNTNDQRDESSSLLAMDLWNDWNLQVYSYSKQQLQKQSSQDDESGFDYIVVRTEDLVSSVARKFATIHKLARFVGCQRSQEEICTYSQHRNERDLGRTTDSVIAPISSNPQQGKQPHRILPSRDAYDAVRSRYGRWMDQLQDSPEMSKEIHRRGSHALKVFGYEPYISILDAEMSLVPELHRSSCSIL
jgi:hypothetical protein